MEYRRHRHQALQRYSGGERVSLEPVRRLCKRLVASSTWEELELAQAEEANSTLGKAS